MSVILTQPDVRFGATERHMPEDAGPALLQADKGSALHGTRGALAIHGHEEGGGSHVGFFLGADEKPKPTAGMVAVGTEEARAFGGEEAVFALLHEARREAAVEMAEERARNRVASPYDGTLRFGLAPKIGAALNGVGKG